MKKLLFLAQLLTLAMMSHAKDCSNITVTISGTATACDSVTLSATVTNSYGGNTYAWSGGTSSGTQADTFFNTGTYTVSVTVTDDSGCVASNTRSVTVNPKPSPAIVGPLSGCSPVIETATGGSTYAWSGGSSPNSATNGITSSGNYTVTVTSSSGCSASTASGTITVRPSPSALITPGGATRFCSGGSVLLTAPSNGNAINFAGRGYVSATGYNVGTSAFTVEAWIYPLTKGKGVIVSQGGVSCGAASYLFEYNNDTLEFQTSTSSGCQAQGIIKAPNSLDTGQWQHVAVSVTRGTSGNLTVLYVNGVKVASGNIANGNIGSTSLNIGGSSTSGYDFNGVIDEVRVWNIALSQTAIQSSLYSIVPAISSGLVTYYRFDEGTGTTPTDLAGGTTGTFNGSLVWQTPSSAPVFENGGTSFLYDWSSGSVVQSTEATTSGSYVVLVTNTANACTASDTVIVTVDTIPTVTIDSVGSLCPGSTLSLTANGGSTYAWSGPNGFTSSNQTNTLSNISTLANGEYSVTATTNQGCSASKFENVGVYNAPLVAIQSNSPQCVGSILTLSATGGITYVWSGPNSFSSRAQDTSIISTVSASGGTYHVTATDVNGCIASASLNDTVNSLPAPTASSSNSPVCAGTTLYLNATGGITYTWSGPNNNASFTSSDSIVNATIAAIGTYYVTVTDAHGCSATDSVQASVNALPAAGAGSNSPLCIGTSLNLTSSGGVSYAWTGPGGFTSSAQDTTITGSVTAGTYTVTVTDGNGCSATASASVTVNSPPASPSASNNGPVCEGFSLTLRASGADSYLWSGPNGFSSTDQNPVIGATLAADSGTYSVTVTTNGCSATATTTATVKAAPVATATNSTVGTQCAGENIYLSASGGTSYAWSGPLGFQRDNQKDTILAASSAATGTYTVTVTGANGCLAVASTSLVVIDVPAVIIAGLNDSVCAGETLELSADGGTSYSWTGPNGFTSHQQDTAILHVTPGAAGTYTVAATNAGGCLATATTIITVNVLPVITSCPGDMTVNATTGLCSAVVNFSVTATGVPTAGIWYSQNPGTVFPLGTTMVQVNAYNDCGSATCTFNITVVDNQPPAFTCPSNISVLANEATDTKFLTIPVPVVTDNCGVASLVNSFNGTSNASGTYLPGTTTVVWTAKDVNGNTSTCSQIITIFPNLVLSGTANNTLCPGTFFGSINTLVAGGQTPYHYFWSNGSTAPNLSNLAAGPYTLTVIDGANDTVSQTFTVQTYIPNNAPNSPGAISGPAYACAGSSATYSIAAVPNAVSYSWAISGNATIISGQGTTNVTVQFGSGFGSVRMQVASVNCVNSSNYNTNYGLAFSVSQLSVPSSPGSIQGSPYVCSGLTYQYTVSPNYPVPVSYNWTIPTGATIVSGQLTNTINVKYPAAYTTGSIKVSASNCAGSSTLSSLTVAASTGLPTAMSDIDIYTPGADLDPTGVCIGDTVSYTVLNDNLANYVANYNWTVPANAAIIAGQGTLIITVVYKPGYAGGNITVSGSNCMGTGAAETQSIPLNTQVPGTPNTLYSVVGNNNGNTACPGDTLVYSINPVSNARSYTWTVPANTILVSGQGTTTVKLVVQPAFSGGNLTVYASNCAGNGGSNYQFINISNPPGSPGNIQGPGAVCPGITYNYTISAANGLVESYVWSVPANATIISGQGTTSIFVSYQNAFAGGTISVYAFNCIVGSNTSTLWVSPQNQAPRTFDNDDIVGATNHCIGDTGVYTAEWSNGASTYTWSVPATTTIISGQGSTNILLKFNTGYNGGSLKVTAANCIGSTSATTTLTHINCGIHDATGIDDETTSAFDVVAYPNPFTGQFNLKITASGNDPIDFKIYDITGKMIEKRENISSQEEVVMGNGLQAGIYLVAVKQGDNAKVVRVIKTE